jgi:CHAD domain-containing protein
MTRLHQRSKNLSHDLSRFVGKLLEGVSEKGVHRLRTTIRRVETLALHAAPDLGRKQTKALEEIRALRKRAGKVRDLDIQIALLSSIGNGSASPDRRALSDALKKKRAKQVERLATAMRKLEGTKLFGRLARIAEGSDAEDAGNSSASLAQIREQLSQLTAQYSSRQPLKPARLHELRIKLKLLRYQTELAGDTPEQKDLIEELKSVQDSIGEWHDWEMLAQSAEKYFSDRVNCALLVEIRSLLAARYSAAGSAAARLVAAHTPAPRKKPAPAQSALALAQRA